MIIQLDNGQFLSVEPTTLFVLGQYRTWWEARQASLNSVSKLPSNAYLSSEAERQAFEDRENIKRLREWRHKRFLGNPPIKWPNPIFD